MHREPPVPHARPQARLPMRGATPSGDLAAGAGTSSSPSKEEGRRAHFHLFAQFLQVPWQLDSIVIAFFHVGAEQFGILFPLEQHSRA